MNDPEHMRDTEKLAKDYLISLGLGEVVYEPDGNCPPDFLVNGRIAVEVRRLNQHVIGNDNSLIPLETDRINLNRCVRKVLASLGPPLEGKSWFVSYDFQRPLLPFKQIEALISTTLTNFRNRRSTETQFSLFENFDISLHPASNAFPTFFVAGSHTDGDSGGWVNALIKNNVRICIEEKTKKISKVRNRYPEWWLVLIDQVSYGIQEEVELEHEWDKVVLVNPLNPTQAYCI